MNLVIVIANDNIDRTLQHLEEYYPRKQKVFLHILEESDAVEAPNGEMGFGVFDTTHQSIYIAADIPEPEINVPWIIAHEYKHYLQWCDDKPYDENEADLFADMVMKELGIAVYN